MQDLQERAPVRGELVEQEQEQGGRFLCRDVHRERGGQEEGGVSLRGNPLIEDVDQVGAVAAAAAADEQVPWAAGASVYERSRLLDWNEHLREWNGRRIHT